jgi:predicted ATPase
MPRLTAIQIRNFRGIQSGDLDGLADATVLVGRNNSGKSTVAEALATMGAACFLGGSSVNPWTQAQGRLAGWYQERNLPHLTDEFWFNKDTSKPIIIAVTIDGVGLSFSVKSVASGGALSPPQGQDAAKAFLAALGSFVPRDAACVEIEKTTWTAVLAPRKDKSLIRSVNEIFGMQIDQIQLPPDGRLLLLLPDKTIALDAHGSGTRAAVRCLIRLTLAGRTVFVMEHPEDHQHPGSLLRLAAAMCKQAKGSDTQLVVTTHSAECVRAFLKGSADAGSSFALLHLALADGKLAVRNLDAETVRGLDRTGVDVREFDLYA